MTIPATGDGGDHIVKLPSREFEGVPENEFSMMTLAGMVGINVPKIDFVPLDKIGGLPTDVRIVGDSAFVIERFDRPTDGTRVYIEDFAQVFDVFPDQKYEKATMRSIARVVAAEGSSDDIAELIRRITFSVLIGNGDMHLKNWSLIYPDRRKAMLAPAYDFVSTVPYIPEDSSALKLSRSRRFDGFTMDEIEHLTAKAALPAGLVRATVIQTVAQFMEAWKAEKNNLPMTASVRDAIDQHFTKLPIISES